MTSLLLRLYDCLHAHPRRLWLALAATLLLLALAAAQLTLSNDPFDFLAADARTRHVVTHLKPMERVSVCLTADSVCAAFRTREASDALINTAEDMAANLDSALKELIHIELYHDASEQRALAEAVYSRLPELLTAGDYRRADSLLTPSNLEQAPKRIRELLLTPAGAALAPYVARDPLMIAAPVLERLRNLGQGAGLSADEGYLLTNDGRRLMFFVDVADSVAADEVNERLYDAVEAAADRAEAQHPGVKVFAYGAPLVSAANARQVQADEWHTLAIALTLLIILFALVFRSVRNLALLLLPVAFGALFALAIIALLHIRLSLVALGVGSVVLGIALSYSTHIITHSGHVASARELLRTMAWPMTVGSLTTVGAFVALLFTQSVVLRHLGLFASLTLVGTLLFSLVFLPHLLRVGASTGGWAANWLQRVAAIDYSRQTWLVALIALLFVVCLFHFTEVGFVADMGALNYVGEGRLSRSLPVVEQTLGVDGHRTTLVVTGSSVEELATNAAHFRARSQSLSNSGVRSTRCVADDFLPSAQEVRLRDSLWLRLTSQDKVEPLLTTLEASARREGFADGAFAPFRALLTAQPKGMPTPGDLQRDPLFAEWLSQADTLLLLNELVETDLQRRDQALAALAQAPGAVQTDLGFFARLTTTAMVADFNFLLLVSSIIVALALLLSYRNLELCLLTFLPMAVSWVIILGLMALCGVQFNVVNIILSTFIFGVGDDYSIFILDGLQADYSRGGRLLPAHKTAILLSALSAMAGLGAQVFGQHPAVHSLGLVSLFGLGAVLLVSFVVQPALWRWLIANPAQKGYPWSVSSALRSAYIYGTFGIVSLLTVVVLTPLLVLPDRPWRRRAMHQVVHAAIRFFVWSFHWMDNIPRIDNLRLEKPAIIVANHQSFVDILAFLATSPRISFVVKGSMPRIPIMGSILRFLDCYPASGGYDKLVPHVRRLTEEGISVVIFPEGTRTCDARIHRFRNGAFLLAHRLQLPIRPVIFYGNVYAVRKQQPFHVRPSLMRSVVLDDFRVGQESEPGGSIVYHERHRLQTTMRSAYEAMRRQYDAVNPYFADAYQTAFRYCGYELEAEARSLCKEYSERESELQALPSVGTLRMPPGSERWALWVALRGDGRRIVCRSLDPNECALCQHSLLLRRAAEAHCAVEYVIE